MDTTTSEDQDAALAQSIERLVAQQRHVQNEQRNMDALRQEQAASDRLFERFLRDSVALCKNRLGNK